MKQVLIVCTANICRSPMVAGLLTQCLDAAGLGDQVIVRSAGTYAEPGKPAWPPVGELMAQYGVDLQRHRSQPISSEMVEAADLIIVMEEGQRQSIFYLAPRALPKVFLLSELAGDADPLADVMGQPIQAVHQARDQAKQWLADGWDRLLARLALVETVTNTRNPD
jgi:protein-tyrosine-phosphatase